MKYKCCLTGTSGLFGIFFTAICAVFLTGCQGKPEHVSPRTGFEAMVQRADSLIDIAPDSTLVLCHEFFREYPATDSLYISAKIIEGNAYFSIGDLDEAKASMVTARQLASEAGDKYRLINSTTDLGVFMRVSQQPDSALALYNEALSMIDNGEYPDEKAHLLTSVAILYANRGMLDEARDYGDRAVEAARVSGDTDVIMYATSQTGAIYNLLGDTSKAYELTRQSIDDARRLGLPRYELKAIGHMIDLNLREGRMDSVNHYLARGEELAAQFPAASVEGIGFLEEKYVVLTAMKRYCESIAVQRRLQALQSVSPTFMPTDKLWLRMARNYNGLHMTDSAVLCYERAFEVSDSLRGEDTDRMLSENYARFKTAEKELALSQMEREKARADMWIAIWIGVTAVLAALVVAGLLYLRSRRRKEEMRLLQSHLRGIEQERGRLAKDLHDGICNDLYGIEMLMQSGIDREELLDDVEKIRNDIRRISHEMMPPSLQDVGLAEALESMVDKLRHSSPGTEFRFSCSPGSGWEKLPAPVGYELYRICQELIGNMLRHASPTEIDIRLERDGADVTLTLSHNGQVSAPDIPPRRPGIGIESVRERLAAIGATAEGLPSSPEINIHCPMKGSK
jgi:signal transduction histidine kinase